VDIPSTLLVSCSKTSLPKMLCVKELLRSKIHLSGKRYRIFFFYECAAVIVPELEFRMFL
jgi:hypothetical protein